MNKKHKQLSECILGLFGIMDGDSKKKFMETLRNISKEENVDDIIRNANFIQMAMMIKDMHNYKFLQDPHSLLNKMNEILTPSKEEEEERKKNFINAFMPQIF